MDHTIEIYWQDAHSNGHAHIDLDNFLPIPQTRMNKLIKLIKEDWKNSENNLQTAIDCCKEKIEDEQERMKSAADKYVKNHQPMLDTERIIKNGKMPSGVTLSRAELKAKIEEHRHMKAVVEAAERTYKTANRTLEQLQKNLQRLEEGK